MLFVIWLIPPITIIAYPYMDNVYTKKQFIHESLLLICTTYVMHWEYETYCSKVKKKNNKL